MKKMFKNLIFFIQLKIVKIFLEPTYYNEIIFFQNIRKKKYDDKKFKESMLRSIFHQFDKKLLDSKIAPELINIYEKKLITYLSDKDIDTVFLNWAKDLVTYAQSEHVNNKLDVRIKKDSLSPEALYELIRDRRSIRSFNEKKISFTLIKKILESGLMAPTGCNRQNINYLLLNNFEDKKYCQKLAGEPGKFVTQAPIAVVILVDCRTYTCLGHRHQAYLETGAAVQNMLLFASSYNIGSIWLNWATTKHEKLQSFYSRFKIKEYNLPTAMIVFGYIKEFPPIIPVRKNIETCLYRGQPE
ncbi:MAG: nitroreductase family protein [Fibrobacter sp.]|nr:nitroreductase family protein [Fibrobacter sp.]